MHHSLFCFIHCSIIAVRMGLLTATALLAATMLVACDNRTSTVAGSMFEHKSQTDIEQLDIDQLQQNGEMVVLTMYGPISFFEFRGENFGAQYRIADAFGQSIGVGVRVEVCRSKDEMFRKLAAGDGDLIAYQISGDDIDAMDATNLSAADFAMCGTSVITGLVDTLAALERNYSIDTSADSCSWMVRQTSPLLESELDRWLNQNKGNLLAMSMPKQDVSQHSRRRSTRGGFASGATSAGRVVTPRINPSAPILNAATGTISHYDAGLRKYAQKLGWDWRLLAAQAYQESGFDPYAVSWMGAQGLMQLMPSTARSFGVGANEVFNPDANLRGASSFIKTLQQKYANISEGERIKFILAAYNAGPGHIDDAQKIARKRGLDPNQWKGNVADVVLQMSEPEYYNDPICKHGYFRGSETYYYVESILARWDEYRHKIRN